MNEKKVFILIFYFCCKQFWFKTQKSIDPVIQWYFGLVHILPTLFIK